MYSKNNIYLRYNRLIFIVALAFTVTMCKSTKEVSEETEEKPKTEQVDLQNIEGIQSTSVLRQIQTESDTTDTTLAEESQAPSEIKSDTNVDDLLENMSLREKIGQLFFIRANGSYTSNDDESYLELVRQINENHIGGIVFFAGDVYGQAVMTNKLQEISDIPLWITQDMEYGAAMRVNGSTRFPPAMGIAATKNPDYAYWVGKITAREAKALGVHQIFAPVLDVNNNPDNPVINVRSFSGDPSTVSTFGNKFIEGVESEGIVATGKHFPGHGDTGTDSHIALPVIDYDFARLDSIELQPFRSAIDSGVKSVMSAHISFPKLSENPEVPATLNESILNRILSDSLDFDGMVVTDGLEMSGISSHFSPGEAVVRALQAGADMMLLSPDELTAINEIEHAIRKNTLSKERLNQSVRKILNWKKEYGLFEESTVNIDSLNKVINTKEHQLLADEISRNSLTLLRNNNQIIPISSSTFKNITVISLGDGRSGNTGSTFVRELRKYHPNINSHVLDERTSREEKRKMLDDARNADLVLIGSFLYVRSGQDVQLTNDQQEIINKLPDDTPSALVAFGNPYILSDFENTDVQLLAWSANSDQVKNTVPALFGGTTLTGALPISIPGMYQMDNGIHMPQTTLRMDRPEAAGLDSDSLRKVDRIMNEAVFDSTFPGGVVAVVKDGVIAYEKPFGYHTYEKTKKVRSSDIYDLASITKVMATTTAVMKLIDENKLALDDHVSDYLPAYETDDKKEITIRDFLLHKSGLPPFREYVDELKEREAILEAVMQEPLVREAGGKYQYSDLGFILLAHIVEKITEKPVDEYLEQKIFEPLGMRHTFFNPSEKGSGIQRRIPPTEIDTVYRNKTVQAEVHDERAYYMDGIAGHAGLFSTARDIAVYTQMLLNKGYYDGHQLISSDIVDNFTSRQSGSQRGLGFDMKNGIKSTAGRLTSYATFGHTGFTGTSFWVDPENDVSIIILTNRTYPNREYGSNIRNVRSAVADAVINSIIAE